MHITMDINDIASSIYQDIKGDLDRSGVMYRLFYRAKTEMSLRHKMALKGDKYRSGAGKIQDMLGFRIVLYFPDDVDTVALHYTCQDLLDTAVDKPDVCTFSPRRQNLTLRIPERHIPGFRASLPEEFAQYIDDAYELQLRTVYSEGWHEVEHDLRYKCSEDWVGYESYSRTMNSVIASLENAEWSTMVLFEKMASENMEKGNFRAMFRNKFRLRFKSEDFSPETLAYMKSHPGIVREMWDVDRTVLILAMMGHSAGVTLTYDTLFFLLNRMLLFHPDITEMEPPPVKEEIDRFIAS